MKISVIVPVYNIESYIEKCINSVLMQSFKDYEVILVDDGSTDNSAAICDAFCGSDRRVRVIHQVNQGLSAARNAGIRESRGEYLYFVDGDDYIHEETLSSFIETLDQNPNSDIILGRMSSFINGSDQFKSDIFDVQNEVVKNKNGQEAFVAILKNQKRIRLGVRGLYRRQFIFEYDLFFDLDNHSEDVDWTVRLFRYAKQVSSNNKPYYFYRDKRPGSITNTLKLKNAKDIIKVLRNWVQLVSPSDINPEFRKIVLKECGRRYFRMFKKFSTLISNHEKDEFFREIDQSKELLNYSQFTIRFILKISFLLFGVNETSLFLAEIQNFRIKKKRIKLDE